MENLLYLQTFYKKFLDKCCEEGLRFFETKERSFFLDWYREKYPRLDWVFANFGATKIVLWEDQLPYVLKIPFFDYKERCTNYCKKELENYQAVVKNFPEIMDCFAKIEYLFDYKNIPVYIMEKVDCDEDVVFARAYDASFSMACERAGITADDKNFSEFFENFSDDFYNYKGIEQMEELLYNEWDWDTVKDFNSFCEERGINDLHSGNWGYRGDSLVVIDYSGF